MSEEEKTRKRAGGGAAAGAQSLYGSGLDASSRIQSTVSLKWSNSSGSAMAATGRLRYLSTCLSSIVTPSSS